MLLRARENNTYTIDYLLRLLFSATSKNTPAKPVLRQVLHMTIGSSPEDASDREEEEFLHLFNTHYKPILVYAKMLTNDTETAREIVQIAFCKYWEKRHSIKKAESVKYFLSRTVKNTFIDEKRQAKRFRLEKESVTQHFISTGQPEAESQNVRMSVSVNNGS